MTGYAAILPELLVLLGVAWALFADRLPGGDRGAAWFGVACMLAAGVAAAFVPIDAKLFGGLLVFDAVARFARIGIAALATVWLLWTAGRGEGRTREAVVLALFSVIGCMFMTEAQDLITLVMAIELATMPAYVLVGYRRRRINGLEGALKYFLLSILTTLVMLYGFSFLYGVTGTTYYIGLDLNEAGMLGTLAVLLSLVGLFAKLSAAPFHYWAPDAYEGAEPWSVAFVSTVPKVAGAVALVRLVGALAPTAPSLPSVLVIAAIASMVLGNLSALTQGDVRRLMAYSGVAHTGYLMLAAAAVTPAGYGAAVFYALAYSIPSLGVMLVAAEEGPALTAFGGLAQRRPWAAWSVVIMLLSLIGIPPLVGFFGKLYLFSAALSADLTVGVLIAIVVSVISAGYYLRIVRSMFFGEAPEGAGVVHSIPATVAVAGVALLTLTLGLAAGPLLSLLGTPIP